LDKIFSDTSHYRIINYGFSKITTFIIWPSQQQGTPVMMKERNNRAVWAALACLALAAAVLTYFGEPSLAGPLDGIASKANDARDQIVIVGKAFIGVVAAVLFVLAATGKVAWMWVGMVVVAGAGLQSLSMIQTWLNG
jgi:hypothetical protein